MEHLPYAVIQERLREARERVPEAFYTHYKTNNLYRVVGHTILEATDEVGIAYTEAHMESVIWIRPMSEWTERVEYNGEETERFIEQTAAQSVSAFNNLGKFDQRIEEVAS